MVATRRRTRVAHARVKLLVASITLLLAIGMGMGNMVVSALDTDIETNIIDATKILQPNDIKVESLQFNTDTLEKTEIESGEPAADTEAAIGATEEEKVLFASIQEAMELDIRTPSNWSQEELEQVVGPHLQDLVPMALEIEEETGVNAVYLLSVAATETLWGKELAGENNYFNWSTTGEVYYPFETVDELGEYTMRQYKNKYTNPDFYMERVEGLAETPEVIDISLVNRVYAKNNDGSCNTQWKKVLAEVMVIMSNRLTNV